MAPKFTMQDLVVIIPAHNEEKSLPLIINSLKSKITNNIIVIDNASQDQTRAIAQKAGVSVIFEKQMGYGNACLAAIKYLSSRSEKPKVVCFFDGDGQSFVDDIPRVADLVFQGKVEYCQGSRMMRKSSRASLGHLARAANSFFSRILALTYRQKVTDLGPLRIVKWSTLQTLEMSTPTYGWTMEMSAKILKAGIIHKEVSVNYDQRTTGKSKISGDIKSAFRAALIMTATYINILIFWRPKNKF